MRRWTKIAVAILLSLLVSLPAGSAWAGHSRTHIVRADESIQDAIDAARPGDTILVKPGRYAESLRITTDNLTLKALPGVRLLPPAEAEPCFEFGPGAPPTVEGIFGNTSWDNPIGIFLRDVSYGTAERNHVVGNCTGILTLAGAPGPLTNWKIRRNLARANNRTECIEEDPVPSGMGILLLGASDNNISRNLVLGNRGEGIEGLGGGIVLAVGGEPGGPAGPALG